MHIDFDERLTADQIHEAIRAWPQRRFENNRAYFEGNNVTVLRRKQPSAGAPNWMVAIPYARKIINTVSGYMYKPGLITYESENEEYLARIREIFEENEEETKTSWLGEQTSIQGLGYEIHYIDGSDPRTPRFARVPVEMGIPIYSFDLEPQLSAFIYFFTKHEQQEIYVYYPDVVEQWRRREQGQNTEKPEKVDEKSHEYEQVPAVVYYNNEEAIGDFEPVKDLIDAYDAVVSDAMNEVDRFATAYLVLKGMSLDEEQLKMLKQYRTFEGLDTDAAVEILTKDIPSEFFQYMSDHLRKEIHKQSHVPNFIEETGGGQTSGVAIDKLLYDFEFIAATKEALFREGLQRRFRLINTILRKTETRNLGDDWKVSINFQRNKPQNLRENAEIFGMYAPDLSRETRIREFAPFVDNVEEEMERAENEERIDVERLGAEPGTE